MDKFIIAMILASIAFCLGNYYIFNHLPEFFMGSAATSFFWHFVNKERDKSTNDLISYLLEAAAVKDKQFILLRKMVEENNNDDRDFTN